MEDRFRPAQFRESDPSKKEATQPTAAKFETGSYVRNLCLLWPEGNRKFYNYAYLVSGEFLAGDEVIRLIFTNETVVIEGTGLLSLFSELLEHVPKEISCTEGRYVALSEGNTTLVTRITVEANG